MKGQLQFPDQKAEATASVSGPVHLNPIRPYTRQKSGIRFLRIASAGPYGGIINPNYYELCLIMKCQDGGRSHLAELA